MSADSKSKLNSVLVGLASEVLIQRNNFLAEQSVEKARLALIELMEGMVPQRAILHDDVEREEGRMHGHNSCRQTMLDNIKALR
jgi:hypothetical protein